MPRIQAATPKRPLTATPPRLAVTQRVAPAAAPKPAAKGWDRQSYQPASDAPPPSDALSRGKAVFSISEAQSKREARHVGEFLSRYPSRGADQVVFFHSYWAQHQTFQKVPLQAYLYSATRPVNEAGEPKNALWHRYATLVETGASPEAIEAAFFRAHIQEFKTVIRTPEFKQLYALATPKYRKVVEAYLDTLIQSERDLDRKGDPLEVGRLLFPRTVRWLAKHGVKDNGFMATWQGVKAMLRVGNPLNRQFWDAFRGITKSIALDAPPERKAPTRVEVSLSEAEARRLRHETGIPFKAGRQALTEEMLEGAGFTEPERRAQPQGPRRRYPLRMSDFLSPDPLHPGRSRAGADGVMDAKEIDAVLRRMRGLVRSELIDDFYRRYPVPHAGVHVYSANMLSMNGAYYGSEMAQTLANAIMPVDNDGKPKNASWQAYADACVSHQRSGHPSAQALESLWWKAHLEDFEIVDTPLFQRQLAEFWPQADKDPALRPLATYAKAMVWGRQNFDRDVAFRSEDSAFASFIAHFTRKIVEDGSFPFWREDLAHAGRWVKGKLTRDEQPVLDDRGLPTERALFERTVSGLKQMTGLRHTVARGVGQMLRDEDERTPTETMVDLAKVLTPAQLAQVDPRVVEFYRHPNRFDVRVGIERKGGLIGQALLGKLAPLVARQAKLPDRVDGFEGYALESELYRDKDGGTHWDRYVVVDGKREPLFVARFETEGRQIKETFKVRGKTITLYFDVKPHRGGVKLTLDREKSSRLVTGSAIDFTVVPSGQDLLTTGRYAAPTRSLGETYTMRMRPKASPEA